VVDDTVAPEEGAGQPVCRPITKMMSSFVTTSPGRLICVSESYISYSIKGNLIRVINFARVTRNKLPAHGGAIVDMCFASRTDDRLASIDAEGGFKVRQVFESNDEQGERECRFSDVCSTVLPFESLSKLCWLDGARAIAIAGDHTVLVLDSESLDKLGEGSTAQSGLLGSVGSGHSQTIIDLDVAPDGQTLLSASVDSEILLWSRPQGAGSFGQPGEFLTCLMRIQPTLETPLSSACFGGGADQILVGSANNRVLHCFAHPTADTAEPWTLRDSLDLRPVLSSAWTNLTFDESKEFLVVASVDQPSLFVLHVGALGFSCIQRFVVSFPILSFVEMNSMTSRHLELFCLQTKAIQKYQIPLNACQPPMPSHVDNQRLQPKEPALSPSPSPPPPPPPVPSEPPVPPSAPAREAAPVHARDKSPPVVTSPVPITSSAGTGAAAVVETSLAASMETAFASLEAKVSARMDRLEAVAAEQAQTTASMVQTMKDLTRIATGLKDEVSKLNQGKQVTDAAQLRQEQLFKESVASINAAVASQSVRLQEHIQASVSTHVRDPISSSFKQCFREMLIPSLEGATQRMFDQINSSLVQGLGNATAAATAAAGPITPAPEITPEEEIDALLADLKYDQAMMKALGAEKLELVTWLCTRVSASSLFSQDPVPLSQTTMICLLQQLGAELDSNTSLKLEWLREIALGLRIEAPEISQYAPGVVQQLRANMEKFAATEAGRQHNTDLRLLTRVLK